MWHVGSKAGVSEPLGGDRIYDLPRSPPAFAGSSMTSVSVLDRNLTRARSQPTYQHQGNRNRNGVGEPVHYVAVAVEGWNALHDFDDRSEKRKALAYTEQAGFRKSRAGEDREGDKCGNVLDFVAGVTGHVRWMR